jgi:hypothetical protein
MTINHTFNPVQARLYLPIAVDLSSVEARLSMVEEKLGLLLTQGAKIMDDFTTLNQKVDALAAISTELKTDVDALLAAVSTGNQAAIDAAAAKVQSSLDSLGMTRDEVVAATPAAPGP